MPLPFLSSLSRRKSKIYDRDTLNRVIFLSALASHIEEVKEVLNYDWFAFSINIDGYLSGVLEAGPSATEEQVVSAATAVQEHCSRVPALRTFSEKLKGEVEQSYVAEDMWTLTMLQRPPRHLHTTLAVAQKAPPPAEAERGDGGPGYVTIPVYFATTREMSDDVSYAKTIFGTARSGKLSFGRVVVSVPDVLNLKTTLPSLPKAWGHQAQRSGKKSKKKIVITLVIKDEEDHWKHRLEHNNTGDTALVFVHGYNHLFSSAAQRLAQVAYHLQAEGPFILFSWPSWQSVQSYVGDEANAAWSLPFFEKFLHNIILPCPKIEKVHLMAHSMGSRLVLYALAKLSPDRLKDPKDMEKIGRVVLAAPDFDAWEFDALAPEILSQVERITLYCSSDDQALRLSTSLHGGYPRLGDFRGTFSECLVNFDFIHDKFDVIDTTGSDTSVLRHGYIFSKFGILRDAATFLSTGATPNKRPGLVEATTASGQHYWVFNDPEGMSQIKMLEEEEPSLLEEMDSPR